MKKFAVSVLCVAIAFLLFVVIYVVPRLVKARQAESIATTEAVEVPVIKMTTYGTVSYLTVSQPDPHKVARKKMSEFLSEIAKNPATAKNQIIIVTPLGSPIMDGEFTYAAIIVMHTAPD
jgi:archaellum biogenesis ATPase FlaH